MMLIRRLSLLLVLALGAAALSAQDDGAEDSGEAAEAPPQPAGETGADESAADDDPLPGGADDDVFVPTEELQADEEVTFPVDI